MRRLVLSAAALVMLPGFFAPKADILEDQFTAGTIYVGVTLGQDWSGFPTYLQPDSRC